MMANRCVRWMVVMVCVLAGLGCGRKTTPPSTPVEPTKTAAEYKAEADKQINAQNASQELSKLEQEVTAEANQP